MAPAPAWCLVDTNILLRIFRKDDSQYQLISKSLEELERQGTKLCFSLQNIAEFWNVCTRPVEKNGFGLSVTETEECVRAVEKAMVLVHDGVEAYHVWRQLVADYKVCGAQVHDAHLVATMQTHHIPGILTLNKGDFERFPTIQAIHPSELAPQAR